MSDLQPDGTELFRCRCCRYHALEQINAHHICPVCFWEDDSVDTGPSGPNRQTMEEGRARFLLYGTSNPDQHTRLTEEELAKYRRCDYPELPNDLDFFIILASRVSWAYDVDRHGLYLDLGAAKIVFERRIRQLIRDGEVTPEQQDRVERAIGKKLFHDHNQEEG